MKYLNKFKYVKESIDLVISRIQNEFSNHTVDKLVKDEILQWCDDEINYSELNNGEAQEIVIDYIISWYERNYGSIDEIDKLTNNLKKTFKSLN